MASRTSAGTCKTTLSKSSRSNCRLALLSGPAAGAALAGVETRVTNIPRPSSIGRAGRRAIAQAASARAERRARLLPTGEQAGPVSSIWALQDAQALAQIEQLAAPVLLLLRDGGVDGGGVDERLATECRLLEAALRHPAAAPLAAAFDRWIPPERRGNPPEFAA